MRTSCVASLIRTSAASAALYCEKERYSGVLHLAVVFTEEAFSKNLEPTCLQLAEQRIVPLQPQCLVLGPGLEAQILASGRPEVVPLLPLCVRSRARIRKETVTWRECIEAAPLQQAEKGQLIGLLGAFVLHRLGPMGVFEINRLLGGFMLEDTQVGRELMEMGRIKGYDQGRSEGLEEGIEKGIEKGIAKGIEKGLLIAQSGVLQVITRRFKRPSPRVIHLVGRLTTLEVASFALTLALEAESLEALEETLSGLADE